MIRILIADDHPVVREGLKRILSDHPDLEVIAEAEDGPDVIEKSINRAVDVLLLDYSMPGPGFIETLRRIKMNRKALPVLVLSVFSEEKLAVRVLKAGASGYLTKDNSPEELATAVRKVYAGGRYVSESLAEVLAMKLTSPSKKPTHESLSDREYDVLCKLGAGYSLIRIAEELALSPKTITTYKTRLLEKMELKNTAELIKYVISHDLPTSQHSKPTK